MAGICYQKGKERGLWYEIKCIEDVVANKKARGDNAPFEKRLLKSYGQYSEADYSQCQLDSM